MTDLDRQWGEMVASLMAKASMGTLTRPEAVRLADMAAWAARQAEKAIERINDDEAHPGRIVVTVKVRRAA